MGVTRMSIRSFTKLVGIRSMSDDLHGANRTRRSTSSNICRPITAFTGQLLDVGSWKTISELKMLDFYSIVAICSDVLTKVCNLYFQL